MMHIKRANYQATAWKRCLSRQLELPTPVDHGWKLSEGQLEIHWMTRPSAPDSLLDFVSCKCKTGCKTLRCSCLKSDLRCTDCCNCVNCQNIEECEESPEEENDQDGDEISDSDYSDDEEETDNEL